MLTFIIGGGLLIIGALFLGGMAVAFAGGVLAAIVELFTGKSKK